jgi:hypothetical protein
MREYYAWERKIDPLNEIAAMNLIDILIGKFTLYNLYLLSVSFILLQL